VYDQEWNFICEARRVEKIHPAASVLGNEEDREKLQKIIEFKRQQEKLASASARRFLAEEVLPEHRQIMSSMGVDSANPRPALSSSPKPEEDKPLTPTEKAKLVELTEKLRKQKQNKPAYTKPNFKDELERYEYLFQLSYRDGVQLLPEDEDWMTRFEQTPTYQTVSRRYDGLKATYAKIQKRRKAL
jgi:putative transposase